MSEQDTGGAILYDDANSSDREPLQVFVCNAIGGDDAAMQKIMKIGHQIRVRLIVNGDEVDACEALKNLHEY